MRDVPRRDCMKMMIEYLENYSEELVVLQAAHGVVIAVGDTHSGLAVFSRESKKFDFYCASNIAVVLGSQDELVYEKVETLDVFCNELAG